MPLLSTASWYRVTFKPTTAPEWKALEAIPSIPYGVIDAVVHGTSLVIHVLDAPSGLFACKASQGFAWDDSLLASAVLLPSIVLTAPGSELRFTSDAGSLYHLTPGGVIAEFDGKQVAEFKAFVLKT